MQNRKIRETAKAAGVKHWEIADGLGISEFHFSRKLRRELPQEELDRIMNIIEQIRRERQ